MVVIFADVKREKIDDLLQFIKARLDELEEEKEELKEFQVSLLTFLEGSCSLFLCFQTQDRKRRTLEYAIYQRELKDVGEMLDTVRCDC